jgi:hypothetical protein
MGNALSLLVCILVATEFSVLFAARKFGEIVRTTILYMCSYSCTIVVYRGDRETPIRGANSVIKKLVNTTSVEAVSYKMESFHP